MGLKILPEPVKGVIRNPKAPEGSRVIGSTDGGDVIYERDVQVLVGRRPLIRGGDEVWTKHPTTGEKLVQKMVNIYETKTETFTLNVERNERGVATGDITKNVLFMGDPEEADRLAMAELVSETQSTLAKRLVEEGISVESLIEAVKGKRAK